MARRGKKYNAIASKVDAAARYDVKAALELLKEVSYAKFDESVDAAIRLNVNPRHADQMVRGAVSLPHGTGKETRVLVFAKGEKAQEAEAAGADFVGSEEIFNKINDGWTEWDVTVATPDMMGQVGRLGRVLGPRGLMPSPKAGTVTFDVGRIVKELKAGRLEFRVDRAGIIHIPMGRISFDNEKLEENLMAIIERVARLKPASAKAPYFRSISISATMSPGIKLDTNFAREML